MKSIFCGFVVLVEINAEISGSPWIIFHFINDRSLAMAQSLWKLSFIRRFGLHILYEVQSPARLGRYHGKRFCFEGSAWLSFISKEGNAPISLFSSLGCKLTLIMVFGHSTSSEISLFFNNYFI